MKRFISALIVFAMIISMVPAVFASTDSAPLATFTFDGGATGSWVDGSDYSGATYTSGDYSLTFTDYSKIYAGGYDANGNGFIKFGTSSVVGTLSFAVPEDVTSVVLHLAGYKAKTSQYSINGGDAVTLTTAGVTASGSATVYDEVTIDTTSNKTVTVSTVSGAARMVMFAVEFYGGNGSDVDVPTEAPVETEAPCLHESVTDYLCDDCGVVVAPAADSTLTVSEAITLGVAHASNAYTSGKYYVTGVITSVYNTTYGNMYIQDADGNTLTVYGTYSADGSSRYDAMETKPVVGDTVTVYGIIGQYSGTAQMKNGWITEHVPTETPCQHESVTDYLCDDCGTVMAPAAGSALTIPEANALGVAHASNAYTTDKYYVTGVITEVKNTTYGNMYITDDAGNTLYLYGTYSADGSTRYDAMEVQPAVGDTITVYGIIGQYSGTAQMKNGWITEHIAAEVPEETEPACEHESVTDYLCDDCGAVIEPDTDIDLTIVQANTLGVALAHNTYTTGNYYVNGVITEVQNSTYGNLYIADENGNLFYIYGLYTPDGETRYDAMEVQPAVGDTITVFGHIGQYNGTAQMKNARLMYHEIAEPEATEPEATEPEATEPEATEPEATEPEATEPEATEPEATEPEVPGNSLDCSGWWGVHTEGVEITADGVTITFDSTTYETAANNWNGPLYVLYTGDEGIVGCTNYSEYWVQRVDNYGWNASVNRWSGDDVLAAAGITYAVDESAVDWDNFLANLKAGISVTITAKLVDGVAVVTMDANGIVSTVSATVDTTKPVYLSLTGEDCTLTNIVVTENKAESNELALGDNSVSLDDGDVDGNTWTYTATEDGNLTITVTYLAMPNYNENDELVMTPVDAEYLDMVLGRQYQLLVAKNGESVDGTSVNVVAGDVVAVTLISNYYSETEATLTLALGETVIVEPAEPGTAENPIAIESLPYEITVDGTHDLYYTYTAVEDCTLLIAYTAGGLVAVDNWEEGPAENTKLVSVAAGETITINPFTFSEDEVSYTYTISVYVEEEPEGPISGAGSYNDPYVITVPDAYVVEKTGSIYIKYTATESGKLTFSVDCENWSYFNIKNDNSGVNSGYLYPEDGNSYTIEMYKGDTITAYLYTTTNNGETTSAFTLSFEPCEVEKTVSVSVSAYNSPSVVVDANGRVKCLVGYTVPSTTLYLTGTGAYSVIIDGETYFADQDGILVLPLVAGEYGTVYTVYVDNHGDEAVTVTFNLAWDLGHANNPEVITDMGTFNPIVPEGYNGYNYTWTAPESGKLTFTMLDESNWMYSIENTYTGVYYSYPTWNDDWTEQLYVPTATVEVNAGDVVNIQVMHEDYSAGELMFSLDFVAGAVEQFIGMYADSYTMDVTPEVAPGASIRYDITSYLSGGQLTVTGENFYVVVGGTGVYSEELGAFLPEGGTRVDPVDGVVYLNLPDYETTTVHIVNTGSEAATYTFGTNYPTGTQANPDVVEDTATVTLDENASDYYYTYTATGDGYVIVTIQSDGGVFYNVYNETSYIYGEYTYVADAFEGAKASMPVYAGDVVYIQVNTWDTDDSIPGGDITVSVEFVEASIAGSIVGYETPVELELPAAGSAVYMLESFWSGTPIITGENYYVKINGEAVMPDDNGNVVIPAGIAVIEIVNTSEEMNTVTADTYFAPGTYDNPEELTMGDHSADVPMYEYYWYFFNATEDGTLTLDMTCDDWYVCEYNMYSYPEYASANGDTAAVYAVTAGDMLLIRVSTVMGNAGTITFTASFEAGSGETGEQEYLESENMLALGDNFIENAADSTGEWYYYVEQTGVLTVTVSDLQALVDGEWGALALRALGTGSVASSVTMYVNDQQVSYSVDTETAVLTLDVTAGDLVTITLTSATGVALRSTVNLAWESNVHDANDGVLVLGNNGFTVATGATGSWTFTAEEAGRLIIQMLGASYLSEDMFGDMVSTSFQPAELLTLFDGGYVNLTVNGEAFVVNYDNGEALYLVDMNLNAGDVVTLTFTNNFWANLDMVVNASLTEAEAGPTIITELPAELVGSFADDDAAFNGLYWNYTAAEAGVLNLLGLTEGAYVDVFVNGLYVTTVTTEGSVEVAAGDAVEFCLYADVAGDYSCVVLYAEPEVNDVVTNVVDFRDLTPADGGDASNSAMESLGVEVIGNWWVQDCYHVFATPMEGYADAAYIQTLYAGAGKVFASDITLDIGYWLAATADPSLVAISVSTDGENWTEVLADNNGSGNEWEASAFHEYSGLTLSGTAGANVVYVKVLVNRHGGQTSGGVTYTTLTGTTRDAEPVSLVTQPENVGVIAGDKAVVNVEATGDCLTYAWYYRNGDSGEFKLTTTFTGSSYSIVMNASRDGRQVYCVITDMYGNSVTTDVVTLSMLPGIEITKQPESVTVANGEKATVTVEATGDGLTYEWFYSDDNGETFKLTTAFTGDTYSLKMTEARNGRQIYCVITDQYGNSVTTEVVTLNMLPGVEITKQPESVTAVVGDKVTVTVEAKGDGLTYEWFYSDDNGETFKLTTAFTGNTYSLKMTAARDGRLLYCVITDQYGNSVTTEVVSLNMKVASGVEITKQPENVTVQSGEKVSVTVEAQGDGLTYEWWFSDNGGKSFKVTTAFTGNEYSLKMTEARAGRLLYCVITDAYGNQVQTETVMIGMTGCLKIVSQPEDDSAESGKRVTATVVATGEGLTYAWYYSDDNGENFELTTAFTGDTYSLSMNAKRDGRQVYCVITDAYGNEVVSDIVTLTME